MVPGFQFISFYIHSWFFHIYSQFFPIELPMMVKFHSHPFPILLLYHYPINLSGFQNWWSRFSIHVSIYSIISTSIPLIWYIYIYMYIYIYILVGGLVAINLIFPWILGCCHHPLIDEVIFFGWPSNHQPEMVNEGPGAVLRWFPQHPNRHRLMDFPWKSTINLEYPHCKMPRHCRQIHR